MGCLVCSNFISTTPSSVLPAVPSDRNTGALPAPAPSTLLPPPRWKLRSPSRSLELEDPCSCRWNANTVPSAVPASTTGTRSDREAPRQETLRLRLRQMSQGTHRRGPAVAVWVMKTAVCTITPTNSIGASQKHRYRYPIKPRFRNPGDVSCHSSTVVVWQRHQQMPLVLLISPLHLP